MKAEFLIYVNDPAHISKPERGLCSELSKLFNGRIAESQSISSQDGCLFVGVFFNRNEIPNEFLCLSTKLYYKCSFNTKPSDWLPFEITLKAGLKRISIDAEIKNVVIVVSDIKITEEDVFAINRSSVEKPNYVAISPEYTLDDVVMNDDERESILRALTIVSEKELIFQKWGASKVDKNTKSILCFHGAAGTGKTMCAHAVADYLGKKILIGSYSQIQSKFVGDGEKNLVAYFKAAEEQDAVLFIDEADTFLSRRLPSSNENSKHYNSMSNELYTLIENFNGCIVFASNHIKDFDPAVISRIIEPVEFNLPDDKARKQIIQKLIPKELPIILTEDELAQLVLISSGFSGRDIRKAVMIFIASSAYKYKVKQGISDEDIVLTYDDVIAAFNHVKHNKEILDKKLNGISIGDRIVKASLKNTRLMQTAALALWSDNKIEDNEKALFDELLAKFDVEININDKNSLPSIETLCSTILSRVEKQQMLDIACRIVAVDGNYCQDESFFIHKLSSLLGLDSSKLEAIDQYINELIEGQNSWAKIISEIHASEYDILSNLRKEYSEAASWYYLGDAYRTGRLINGETLTVNLERSQECLERAAELGYKK